MTSFVRWDFHAEETGREIIIPDGCVDILILSKSSRPRRVLVTDLDVTPRRALIEGGVHISGFRLRPGIFVNPRAIAAAAPEAIAHNLESFLCYDVDVLHVIQGLAAGDSLATAACRLGVSPRGLQRRLRGFSLPPPDFWRLLGRARSAATALPDGAPLAEIAADFGYSDQSHMTREFVRWLGIAPDRLRHAPERLNDIRQPGLGNWTGEQISTR